jgi:hypothetical protein
MRRRGFLALLSAGTLGLAGCSSSCTNSYTVDLVPVDDADVVSRSVLSVDGTDRRYEAMVLRDLAAAPGDPYVALPGLRLREDAVVRLDDTYYRIRQERVTRDGYRVSRAVELPADEVSADVRYADLPAADRKAVLASCLAADLLDGPAEERRDFVARNTEDGDLTLSLSYLTPDPETPLATAGRLFVSFEGLTLSVGLRNRRRETIETERLTATEVGSTTEAAAETVLAVDGLRVDESSLSAGDREFLDAAAESEQTICVRGEDASPETDTPTLSSSLRERLRGTEYVRYDGRWYAVEVSEMVV